MKRTSNGMERKLSIKTQATNGTDYAKGVRRHQPKETTPRESWWAVPPEQFAEALETQRQSGNWGPEGHKLTSANFIGTANRDWN